MITALGQQIVDLRKLGHSYNYISTTLKCSKATVSYYCGSSQKEKSKSRDLLRRAHRRKREISHRNYLQKLSMRYKALVGCKVCGEKDPVVLEYDHLDSTEKLCSVSILITDRHSVENVKKEIRKCQVLCANCHRRKTAETRNYMRI